jgi:hypothetical protein
MKSMYYLANMDFKRKYVYPFLILISFLFSFATCKKSKGDCIGNAYRIKQNWNILPQRDSISIGDTLFFTSYFLNNLLNYNNNSNFNIPANTTIGSSFGIRKIEGYNNLKDAVDSFNFVLTKGRLIENSISPKKIKDFYWLPYSDSFKISFTFIAKSKGDYLFTVPDGLGRFTIPNECENSINIDLNNVNFKNNAYQSHIYYGLTYTPVYDSLHNFCIRVK